MMSSKSTFSLERAMFFSRGAREGFFGETERRVIRDEDQEQSCSQNRHRKEALRAQGQDGENRQGRREECYVHCPCRHRQ